MTVNNSNNKLIHSMLILEPAVNKQRILFIASYYAETFHYYSQTII